MCCTLLPLLLFEGTGVGGNGVAAGVGAPVWFITTGIMKSYAATFNTHPIKPKRYILYVITMKLKI